MPAWIHERAKSIMPHTKKQYGPEKGKQVAFALATQQAEATGKAPKTWKGEPFGTLKAKIEAHKKYPHPAKMQKTAQTVTESAETADPEVQRILRTLIYPGAGPTGPAEAEQFREPRENPELSGTTKMADEPGVWEYIKRLLFGNAVMPTNQGVPGQYPPLPEPPPPGPLPSSPLGPMTATKVGEGLAERRKFTVADADPQQLRMGCEVEHEHTNDPARAEQIALDHLSELPDYYTRLKCMEKSAVIREEHGGFTLYTRDGGRVLGHHPTKQDAIKQEYAIEMSKKREAAKHAGALEFEELVPHVMAALEKSARADTPAASAPVAQETPSVLDRISDLLRSGWQGAQGLGHSTMESIRPEPGMAWQELPGEITRVRVADPALVPAAPAPAPEDTAPSAARPGAYSPEATRALRSPPSETAVSSEYNLLGRPHSAGPSPDKAYEGARSVYEDLKREQLFNAQRAEGMGGSYRGQSRSETTAGFGDMGEPTAIQVPAWAARPGQTPVDPLKFLRQYMTYAPVRDVPPNFFVGPGSDQRTIDWSQLLRSVQPQPIPASPAQPATAVSRQAPIPERIRLDLG